MFAGKISCLALVRSIWVAQHGAAYVRRVEGAAGARAVAIAAHRIGADLID